ncbi:MAG TPA: response regulator transcription factor [Aurantimonas coralicida]|uniref:Response regulator transcription factor n=2 Tax=root TaxID=1 RepID=A0A9C9THC7_9HYPH|nr:response regulator transcription factor [Aurantimonas coralicida]HEU00663.1 response regulator transcription factor [Aurantimonas coralicida]
MSKIARVSIAIIDDHPIVRQGLASVLANEPQFDLVAEGISAKEAVDIAQRQKPDLMILDLGIPGGGISALTRIAALVPSVKCIILTVCDSAETAISALNAGAKGYILKGVSARDLTGAIWTVVHDESFVSPEFATKLLQAAQVKNDTRLDFQKLSFRESQILDKVELGLTNKQIADHLNLSEKTVKYYMSIIMHKFGVANRVSAVIAAQKLREPRTSING